MDARPRQRDAIDVPRAKRHLHDVIVAYRAKREGNNLDEYACDLLMRLADSSEAATAFERLKLKDGRDDAGIVEACIEADELNRTFSEHIRRAEKALARLGRLRKEVASLRKYVRELAEQPPVPDRLSPVSDRLSAKILEPPDNVARMKGGLALTANRVETDWRVANETMLRLGAVRTKGSTTAAARETARENAVIGWLAEGVLRVSKRAHAPIVAKLTNVILRTDTVTEDRVRHAVRARSRDWRQP